MKVLILLISLFLLVRVASLHLDSNCAICFYGLSKKFHSIVYPSIAENILQKNPSCDIFVHTYHLTSSMNVQNSDDNYILHMEEILLSKSVKYVYDMVSDVDLPRNVTSYLKYFPRKKDWWYPDSMINMIRQWESIERVWYAMAEHSEYKIVGMFPLDVKYITPIFMNDEEMVVPKFRNLASDQYNGQMFYGSWKYIKAWSTSRFDLIDEYLKTPEAKNQLDPESFMFYMSIILNIPVITKPICFWKVSNNTGSNMTEECKVDTPAEINKVNANKENIPAQMKKTNTSAAQRECALCFFGVPKKFKSIIYPSIIKNLIHTNPNCDIFVHTFNITSFTNPRNGENNVPINVNEILLLNAVEYVWDLVNEVDQERNIHSYLKYFPHETQLGWYYPNSMLNMIRQWHSIERVWYAMEAHAQYKTVGMFRSDVKYLTPIFLNDGEAVIPKFANWDRHQFNDRMFYGAWEYTKKWSTSRFSLVPQYVKTPQSKGVVHSERFMFYLITTLDIPFVMKSICFCRVRSGGEVKDDCKA